MFKCITLILLIISTNSFASSCDFEPSDTDNYLYSKGISASQSDAYSQALNKLLEILYFEGNQETTYKTEILSRIFNSHKLTINKIISNITVVKKERCLDEWNVVIKVNKESFNNFLKVLMDEYSDVFSAIITLCESDSGLYCYRNLNIASFLIPKYTQGLQLYSSKHNTLTNDVLALYLASAQAQLKKVQLLISKISHKQLLIILNSRCSKELNLLITTSLQENFIVIQNKPQADEYGYIRVQCEENQQEAFDEFMHFLTLHIKVVNKQNVLIIRDKLNIKGHSFESLKEAKTRLNNNIHANLTLFLEKSWLIRNYHF